MAESNVDPTFIIPRPKRKRTLTYKAREVDYYSDVTDSEEDPSSESFVPNSDDEYEKDTLLDTSESDVSTQSLMDTYTSDTEQDVHIARDKTKWSEVVPDTDTFVDDGIDMCSGIPDSVGEVNSISGFQNHLFIS